MKQHYLWNLLAAGLMAATSANAAIVTTYPAGTILENIAIAPGGNLFVTDLGSGTIFQVTPGGSSSVFGEAPGPLAGIAVHPDGTVVAVGGTSLYRFSPDGTPSLVTDIPGSGFLNGVAALSLDSFLVTDDTANLIWLVSIGSATALPWLASDLFLPEPGGLPIGPNGIKLFNGAAYLSNTGAGSIVRVPILIDGSPGTPAIYASNLVVDDFAFGSDGSLFAATQLGEIIRLYPDGTRTTLETGTLGDAAVAFGRTAADVQELYVVNNGGAFLGLPEGPEDASIVRLTTNVTGVTPESQTVPEPSSLWMGGAGSAILLVLMKRRSSEISHCLAPAPRGGS